MATFVGIVAIFVYMLLHFSQGESRQGLRLIICGGNELMNYNICRTWTENS